MNLEVSQQHSIITPELYFLISKFLAVGPLKETAKVLKRELEKYKILPKRFDWEGNKHDQSFEELEFKYPHISAYHLLEICSRIGPILEKEIPPSVPGILSLLGAGKQSLLRTSYSHKKTARLIEHSARWRGMPLLDPPCCKNVHNIAQVILGREYSGPVTRNLVVPSSLYSKQQLLRRTLGHLTSVYCLLFDRTGLYIITGADDHLVKVWSSIDGRLLNTFRGSSAEITDIDINFENTLLAAGSLDRLLRVWDLQTGGPIAVLSGHTGMITSVNFCPSSRWDLRYLITTSTDGSVAFWTYTYSKGNKATFVSKPIQYHERMRPGQAQMICASFSPGGMFLAAGSADHHVRVYLMHGDEGPHRILELEAHTDTVDSIQWAHQGLRFISGSKDGTAHVWHFESQQWKSHQLLMNTKLPGIPSSDEESKKLKVTMVTWNCSDTWVITAVNDYSLKVWNASSGKLTKVLTGHTDEVYVLEAHPFDAHILLSTGHDGQIFIWDIIDGISLVQFVNNIEGQGHGSVFDAKWSPDGTMIAATDSHGHLLLYGSGIGDKKMSILPKELFFHTDYRPLVRDAQQWVLDEQTQTAPHLMPPPFLVDIDGNPYPPVLQRFVPGREHCPSEQLIPNIALGDGGLQEVIEGIPAQEPRSDIDLMIAALAQRQFGESVSTGQDGGALNRHLNSPRNGHRILLRRNGDVEGVRQSSGNWQHDGKITWTRKTLIRPLGPTALRNANQEIAAMCAFEMELYRREMRRRPVMINTAAIVKPGSRTGRAIRSRNKPPPAYRTRAVRSEQREREESVGRDSVSVCTTSDSDDTSIDYNACEADMLMSGSGSDSESSGYSDWVADHGITLQPPKRSKRKPVKKRPMTPPSEGDRKRIIKKKKITPIPHQLIEVPEEFRPPEWLSEVVPRKAPYYPQMGDEIMYFRQGHQLYIDAVRTKNVYVFGNRNEPLSWLKSCELVKVVGIKYEIKPPRLCCLKLALMSTDRQLTGETFTLKYHDMADVLDFLVLRQTYDIAMQRNWKSKDRFRCMIDDCWWLGTIEYQAPINPSFPESPFMCYRIRWDNGEYEHMSPWDLEPINENRMPTNVGEAVRILPEEICSILYQPLPEEWPGGDREATCRRIIGGLDQVMGLAIAEPFVAPVDLNHYPSYAFVVEYPIDLSTIKGRFENHFYRRITSAQFDVRYLATNAEKFNEPHSQIVKQARIITELCLKIINDRNDLDVGAVYHQLVDTYQSSDSEIEPLSKSQTNSKDEEPSTSGIQLKRLEKIRRSVRLEQPSDWKKEALSLLEILWQSEDSSPFREPVDQIDHPDYYQIIRTPMDLGTVKEELLGGNYKTPKDFCKDIRLIFQNSRKYNTDKKSRIYCMTIRLSSLFEEHARNLLYNWKSAVRRTTVLNKKPCRTPLKMVTRYNGTGSIQVIESSTSDDEETELVPVGRKLSVTRKIIPLTNETTKISPSTSGIKDSDPMLRPTIKLRISNNSILTKTDTDDELSNKSNQELFESSDISSSDSDSSETVANIGLRLKRNRKTKKSDSEDSYKPNRTKGKSLINRKTRYKGKVKRTRQKLKCDSDSEYEIENQYINKKRPKKHNSDSDFKIKKKCVVLTKQTSCGSESEYETLSNLKIKERNKCENNLNFNVKLLKQEIDNESNECNVSEDSGKGQWQEEHRSGSNSEIEINKCIEITLPENSSTNGRPVRKKRPTMKLVETVNGDGGDDDDNNDADENEQILPKLFKRRTGRTRRRNYRFDSDSDIEIVSRPRRGKRRHYGEESDDSNSVTRRRKRKSTTFVSDDSIRNEPAVSISSRGRVRKLTARARALLRD